MCRLANRTYDLYGRPAPSLEETNPTLFTAFTGRQPLTRRVDRYSTTSSLTPSYHTSCPATPAD